MPYVKKHHLANVYAVGWGAAKHMSSIFASYLVVPSLILAIPPQKLMYLRFSNGAGLRKLDRGLKILIKPI